MLMTFAFCFYFFFQVIYKKILINLLNLATKIIWLLTLDRTAPNTYGLLIFCYIRVIPKQNTYSTDGALLNYLLGLYTYMRVKSFFEFKQNPNVPTHNSIHSVYLLSLASSERIIYLKFQDTKRVLLMLIDLCFPKPSLKEDPRNFDLLKRYISNFNQCFKIITPTTMSLRRSDIMGQVSLRRSILHFIWPLNNAYVCSNNIFLNLGRLLLFCFFFFYSESYYLFMKRVFFLYNTFSVGRSRVYMRSAESLMKI